MIVQNCRLRKKEGLYNLVIENGRFKSIIPQKNKYEAPPASVSGEEILDARGKLITQPFIEPHIHLDAVLTAGEPRFNQSGTLFEGIQIWAERKSTVKVTKELIKDNARKVIRLQTGYGIQAVRTHVDVTDPSLLALDALTELKEELRDLVDIQIVAFPQDGILSFPNGKELMEEALRRGADVIGAIPHYEYTRDMGVESLKFIVELAEKYNRLIDVHCDETDDEQSRFLEVLANLAYATGLGSRVTASHTTAMHSYNNAYCYKLFNLLKKSQINFVSCPTESIHLQGRMDTYPKRRGITRVKELTESGMIVALGQDSVCDPWYPIGTGNLLRILDMGLHVCQIMGYNEIQRSLDFITENSAKALSLEKDYGIAEGKPARFILLDAADDYDAVRFLSDVLYSYRDGRVLFTKKPAVWEYTL